MEEVNTSCDDSTLKSELMISPEIASFPTKVSNLWLVSLDTSQRKLNFPPTHRYGLCFTRSCFHTFLSILLAGDVSTNPGPPAAALNTNSAYKCVCINARSLKSIQRLGLGLQPISNMERFQDLVYSEDCDICCVNETWLNKDIQDKEILHGSDYQIFRKDRDSRGGGVLVALKTASFKDIHNIQVDTNLEIVLVEVTSGSNSKFLICSCYRPPNTDHSWFGEFSRLLGNVSDSYDNMIISGDFNLPNILWETPENTTGSDEIAFLELLNDYFLTQMNTAATRGNNTLDLVITNTPEKIRIREILSPEDGGILTDHAIILFDLLALVPRALKHKRFVYDYRNADFIGLRSYLQQTAVLSNTISEKENINDDWISWKSAFQAAVKQFVPSKKIRGRNSPPWISGEILHAIKKKARIRRQFIRSRTDHLKEKFKRQRSVVKHLLKESRDQFFGSLDRELKNNPKRFWSLLKLKSKSSNFPQTMSMASDNNTRIKANDPDDIANLFNRYFTSVFTTDHGTSIMDDLQPDDTDESLLTSSGTLTFTKETVEASLKKLDPSKALGPDGIPARLLKETAIQVAPSLCALFNKSLSLGIVPDDWKLANVVPVFKKGEKDHMENYRPISLLSLVSKVMERCVFTTIKDQTTSLISTVQHGFVPGRSCTTQLIEVLDHIGSLLDRGNQIDVIYLDMSKAFDKVSHRQLINKLYQYGFRGNILNWFQSYLHDRKQRVTVLGATSIPLSVTSGVPQGSILGPMLFLLYVNDLPETVSSSRVATFADDTKLFKAISNMTDSSSLQKDLEDLGQWSLSSGLKFNESKCKVQTISRKKNNVFHPYSMNNIHLKRTKEERDLGVWITSDLSWKKQVLTQCAKANQLLGYVRRSTKCLNSQCSRRTIYLTIIRPHLGYATQVWAPQSVELIRRTELVQRRATKYILGLPYICDINYKERLLRTELLPLCYWHEYLDMVLFYKLVTGIAKIDPKVTPSVISPRKRTRNQGSAEILFKQPFCRTSTYQKSFLIRTTRIWNSLPQETRQLKVSLSSYKSLLLQYYTLSLQSTYDPDDLRSWRTICVKCNSARSLHKPLTCCF